MLVALGNPIQSIRDGFGVVIKDISHIQSDVTCLTRVLRIAGYVFAFATPSTHAKLQATVSTVDNFVSFAQAVEPAYYLIKGESSVITKISDCFFLFAGIATALDYLDHVGLITLPTTAFTTGSWSVLGAITKGVIGKAIPGMLIGAFFFKGIQSAVDLNNANDDGKKWQGRLDVLWCISEVAFFALGMAGVLTTVGLMVVGLTSALIGVAAFLHSKHLENRNGP